LGAHHAWRQLWAGRDAALSRQQPIRPAGKHQPRLPWTRQRPHGGTPRGSLPDSGRDHPDWRFGSARECPGGGWSITPSPNPRVPTGQLFWVSCPTAHSWMAVGTYVKASGIGVNLAEQWNGTAAPGAPWVAFPDTHGDWQPTPG
jgi:hypothetical protein